MSRGSRIAYAVLVALLCASAAIAVVAVVGAVVLAVRPDAPSPVGASRAAAGAPTVAPSTPVRSGAAPSSTPTVDAGRDVDRAQALVRKALGSQKAAITVQADGTGTMIDVSVDSADDGLQDRLTKAVAGTGVTVLVREPYLSATKLAAAEKRLRAAFAQPPLDQYKLLVERDATYGRLLVTYPSRLPRSLLAKVEHLTAPYGPGVGLLGGP